MNILDYVFGKAKNSFVLGICLQLELLHERLYVWWALVDIPKEYIVPRYLIIPIKSATISESALL